jgi:hypothetical protein
MAQENEESQTSEPEPALDWTSAEVKGATLTVPLNGELSKPWKGLFERTVKLLGGGDWDAVELKSGKVKVTGVQEGSEGSLRHFLEGAVQEANAALREDEDDGENDQEADDSSSDERGEDDSRMTERFRDFGA